MPETLKPEDALGRNALSNGSLEERRGPRFILHVDMDSYYASAEMARNPKLKDTPVIVGAPPAEGRGRGVVLASNYPARAFGVRSGMPISEAWRRCPAATYLRPDFEYYESLSDTVMNVIKGFGPKFEQASIDEAFLDVTEQVRTTREALNLANKLRSEIRIKTGLTSSVGIAGTKSSAKIASDMNKPDKVTIVPEGGIRAFLAPLPVKKISGVGPKTEAALVQNGLNTVGDIQRADPGLLKRLFGSTGAWLWSVANGLDDGEVRERSFRSLSTETTFGEDTSDWEQVRETVRSLSSELGARVSRMNLGFKTVGIKVRFAGFETHTREKSLPAHSEGQKVIEEEALELLREFEGSKKPVRLVGVRVSSLRFHEGEQVKIEEWAGRG
jgi:nucleotidyltransferase/DNA polymerase involved in DNA repair